MFKFYLLGLFLVSGNALSFQCEEITLENHFNRADRVFLAFITDTKLEDNKLAGVLGYLNENKKNVKETLSTVKNLSLTK